MEGFSIERRIYYHATDAGGVVYYANYLKLFEEGRTEFCLNRGLDLGELMGRGVMFPVVHVEAEYKSPARYADMVEVATRVEKVGRSSVHFYQEILRKGQLLVLARTVWACVGSDFRSRPLPEDIAEALRKT